MRFTKLHGLGNDFILIERSPGDVPLTPQAAAALCDRATGVGADGTLELSPRQDGWRLVIRNADGSRPEMCGNGLRCVGRYLARAGRLPANGVQVQTDAGPRHVQAHGADIRVDMGDVRVVGARTAHAGDRAYQGTLLDAGNPHFVLWGDWRAETPAHDGPIIETAPVFPAGANVAFAAPPVAGRIAVTIWERGSGLTGACGSGACAVAASAWARGHSGALWVDQPGGALLIEQIGGRIYMTGPAVQVFEGELSGPR